MILFGNKLENLNKVDAFDIKICYAEKKKNVWTHEETGGLLKISS